MKDITKTAASLKIGERGIISSFLDENMSLKLLEMGCLPGSEVILKFKAPPGDPICIRVSGYDLSLRLEEAAVIILE